MASPTTKNEWVDKISSIDTNWNSPRARIYITIVIDELARNVARLQKELDFEKAVNNRVQEVMKVLITPYKEYPITGPAS